MSSVTGALNESPSEKEGKLRNQVCGFLHLGPSMKVPLKRKGNARWRNLSELVALALNESPSEKEGKFRNLVDCSHDRYPQ